MPQAELSRNRVRAKRIDIWQQAVDTEVFNPRFRSHDMRVRMSDGHPDACILTYVGRLGSGARRVMWACMHVSCRAHIM